MTPREHFTLARNGALALVLAVLTGCAGVAVGAGATAGVAALQERGLEVAAKDLKIEARILAKWLEFNDKLVLKIGTEVYEGRVLLTGAVRDPALAADAVRMSWSVAGVKEVLNEIQVVGSGDLVDLARDAWITTQLLSVLTVDKEILAINYVIETVNGTVYLMGIAQNQTELDRVEAHARNVEYVRKIISHVRVKEAS